MGEHERASNCDPRSLDSKESLNRCPKGNRVQLLPEARNDNTQKTPCRFVWVRSEYFGLERSRSRPIYSKRLQDSQLYLKKDRYPQNQLPCFVQTVLSALAVILQLSVKQTCAAAIE